MYVLGFSTELQKAEVSIPSQTLFQKFWKFSEQTKETLAVGSVFGIVISEWIGQLKLFNRNTKLSTFFPNILSKMYEEIILETFI